MAYELEKGKI